jgi:hypothetical protein
MNDDVPSIDLDKPFRLHGRLVQGTDFSFTDSSRGMTFEVNGICLYEASPYIDVNGGVVAERDAIIEGTPALEAGAT